MFVLAIFALTLTLASATLEANWLIFKAKHNKTYSSFEDGYRRYIWQTNLKKIEEHNELYRMGIKSFYLQENKYADMTSEEFTKTMNRLRITVEPGNLTTGSFKLDLPSSVDWRQKGVVTGVKDQGDCGSCWAFSTTGSIEGQHALATGVLVSLSESNLVDCSTENDGCEGGWMSKAFAYVIHNNGIDREASYPYTPKQGTCAFSSAAVGAKISSYKTILRGNELALQQAVAGVGPISVAIDASHQSFQLYGGGVYSEPACSSTSLDHGVLAVGYGTDGAQDYWIVKNSWGVSWGLSGYIKMIRNKNNNCGIASSALYPIV
ncbi:procathepsin L-like [Physella acuta]|uniref:procathepsin L-like n=1 Tax=Physella acuta TaxID=109671 RepID=UPI0027DDD94E|nr:procathepsin L-like [Physella acuta]